MRIYLSAEGKRDIGGLADPVYGDPSEEGFFQPLIRQVIPQVTEFVSRHDLALGRDVPRTLKAMLERRAHRAVALADVLDCAAVVIHVDADQRATSARPPSEYLARREKLAAGIQAAGSDRPPAVMAVPIGTTEAWALADRGVLATMNGNDDAALRREPETLWGKPHDPASNHPKCVLDRVVGSPAGAHVQAHIAERMDLTVAKDCCPRSLAPFIDDLSAVATQPPS